ncbi:MAG: thioredoxin-dependent thiol peroxidase [Spirochaetes bacterium RBG_16_67_19]|nr:MAG: thioredoxin-dependent thiol peroxidase [Spirochaetes bacterium RBG_16_67_19]
MAELSKGAKAPSFSLQDQDGKTVKLGDSQGRKLLLYFYPKADTPGCTTQACSIRDAMPDLKSLGIAAVGISPDEPKAQKKFADKYQLSFPLLSDPQHATAVAYGAWGENQGILRSSFLIDEAGKILQAWYKVSPADTVPLAKEALLQARD